MTVIDDQWWFNAKINGRGAFLHDSPRPTDAPNLAQQHPDVVKRLFDLGRADAGGSFPNIYCSKQKARATHQGAARLPRYANAARVRSRTIRSIAKH